MKRALIPAIALPVAAFVSMSSLHRASQSQERKPDETTEKWVADVAASLPVDEPLRYLLETGHRGTGIHEAWMDSMKKQGVKQVLVNVKGTWYSAIGFRPGKPVQVVYRTEYSRPDSQIVDDMKLTELRKSGLEEQLETVATQKSKQALWVRIDSNPFRQPGFARVVLNDSEWIPSGWLYDRPLFSAFEEEKYPLYSAAIYPDLVSATKQLATNSFSQVELDTALFGATANLSDNTKMIELLVKSGANVNACRNDGSTVLMESASALHLATVKLLLSLGADPNLKNQRGDTALSWVEGRISTQRDSGPPLPDYVSEIVRLLKEAGAVSQQTPGPD